MKVLDRNGTELALEDTVLQRRGVHSGKQRMLITGFDIRSNEVYLIGVCLETRKKVKWLSHGTEKQ